METLLAPDSLQIYDHSPSPLDKTRATNDRHAFEDMPERMHGHRLCTAPCHNGSLCPPSLELPPPKLAHPWYEDTPPLTDQQPTNLQRLHNPLAPKSPSLHICSKLSMSTLDSRPQPISMTRCHSIAFDSYFSWAALMQLISAFPVVCGNVDNKILVRGIAEITKRTTPMHCMNLLRCHHLLHSPNFGKRAKPFLIYSINHQCVQHIVHLFIYLLCIRPWWLEKAV